MKKSKPLITLLIVALLGFLSVGITGLYSFKESLIQAKKEDIATVLKIVRNQSAIYIDQYRQGLLTKEETDEKIIEFLSAMQYESAYVWANDNLGIARVHARKEVIGQFQHSYVKHMAQLVDRDISFITEINIKPIVDEKITKINGISKIPEWDWVIGFGIYMDDIDDVIFSTEMLFVISILISMLLTCLVAVYWIRKAKHS